MRKYIACFQQHSVCSLCLFLVLFLVLFLRALVFLLNSIKKVGGFLSSKKKQGDFCLRSVVAGPLELTVLVHVCVRACARARVWVSRANRMGVNKRHRVRALLAFARQERRQTRVVRMGGR